MIDCSKFENYFAEKRRMTKEQQDGVCKLKCTDCPLSSFNNGSSDMKSCFAFEKFYPKKAVVIVQKWSDEHPQKTYLSEFLKAYPNTLLNDAGLPKDVCLYNLGLTDCRNDRNCVDCWNQPIEDGEE
jgi:hypothetical protein